MTTTNKYGIELGLDDAACERIAAAVAAKTPVPTPVYWMDLPIGTEFRLSTVPSITFRRVDGGYKNVLAFAEGEYAGYYSLWDDDKRVPAIVTKAAPAPLVLTWPDLAEGQWFEFVGYGSASGFRRREGIGYRVYEANGEMRYSHLSQHNPNLLVRVALGLTPSVAGHNTVVAVPAAVTQCQPVAPVGTIVLDKERVRTALREADDLGQPSCQFLALSPDGRVVAYEGNVHAKDLAFRVKARR